MHSCLYSGCILYVLVPVRLFPVSVIPAINSEAVCLKPDNVVGTKDIEKAWEICPA
jgi:hypothetical protein